MKEILGNRNLRRKFFTVGVAALGTALLTIVVIARKRLNTPPQIDYQQIDGHIFASINAPHGHFQMPFLRQDTVRFDLKTYVWRDGEWKRDNTLLDGHQYGWSVESGYHLRIKVPDSKWKFTVARVPRFKLGTESVSYWWSGGTNVVTSPEYPNRAEIERQFEATP